MVYVKSYTRKSKNGKRVRVNAHSRSKPKTNPNKREMMPSISEVHPLASPNTPNSRVLHQIEDLLKAEIEDIRVDEDGVWEFDMNDGSRYLVFRDEDTAVEFAEERVRDKLEWEPEIFNRPWLVSYIDEDNARRVFTDIYEDWNWGYVEDIAQEKDKEYANRQAREMLQRGIISEKEATSGDYHSGAIEEFVEQLTQEQLDEGLGGFEHYQFNFGDEEAWKLAKEYSLFDIDEAAEAAVTLDGWQHFVAHYDGTSTELPSGEVLARID